MSPATAAARRATATATAPARAPRPGQRRTPARPNLRVVTPVPSRAPRAPFLLFSILVVGAGLVGLLVLNTVVAQDAFTIHDLDRNTTALDEREQRLEREVAALEAPRAVADRAGKLGLVPAGDPVFLTADGKVLGHPVPATAPPAPPPPPQPSAQPSAAPTTAPATKPTTAAKPTAKTATTAKTAQPTGAP
jgi:cell division protein FtsB